MNTIVVVSLPSFLHWDWDPPLDFIWIFFFSSLWGRKFNSECLSCWTLHPFYFPPDNQRLKMPTNFTVVPVEDMEGGSNNTAIAGGGKPASLGRFFEAEEDEDNLQGSHTGSVRQNIFFGMSLHTQTLNNPISEPPLFSFGVMNELEFTLECTGSDKCNLSMINCLFIIEFKHDKLFIIEQKWKHVDVHSLIQVNVGTMYTKSKNTNSHL